MGVCQRAARGEDPGAFQPVAQFADIARPAVAQQRSQCGFGQPDLAAAQHARRERQDIGRALCQWRERQRKDREPPEEILAEPPGGGFGG